MVNVSIIGVGRVGGALSISLPADKYTVEHLIGRNDAVVDIGLRYRVHRDSGS